MDKLNQHLTALFGIRLTARQMQQFDQYAQELMKWNARYNLTAIRDLEGIHIKHFLDSLSCVAVLKEKPPNRLIDIGTGAGFPGIPLKIVFPSMRLTLVDSVAKKTQFCEHIVHLLGLEQVEVLQCRAEEVGHLPAHREQYDWAIARAVANLPALVEYLLPLVRVGGSVLAQKGESGPAEAHAADHAIHILGGRLRQLRHITLPGVADERYLIIIDKVATTPPKFPRRVGVPAKTPLK